MEKQRLDIPFYKNTKDDLRCVQAALRSVLKYILPSKNYSFSYLDLVTAHKKDKWTWDGAMLLFLARLGFDVVYITKFDYKKFAHSGEKYLRSLWTDEIYKTQKQHSDFVQEQKFAKLLIKNRKIHLLHRQAIWNDVRRLWSERYLLMISVNACILDSLRGYSSHMVTITGITKQFVYFHDPGNPPIPNRKVSVKKFWKAASYPNGTSADIIALRKPIDAT